MVHRFRSVVVAVMLLIVLPVPGWAAGKDGWWGWLERLSGPGPFGQRWGPTLPVGVRSPICLGDQQEKVDRKTCLYFDYAPWISEDDHLVGGDVKLDTFDVGASYRVGDGLELGVGLGVYHFRTEGTSATRVTLTPGRLVVKPLVLLAGLAKTAGAPTLTGNWKKGFSVLKWYYKTSVLLGRIDGTDFGIQNSPWPGDTNNAVSSVGFLIDIGELIP